MLDSIERCNNAISESILRMMRSSNLAFDISVLLNLKREYTEDPDIIIAVNSTTLLINPDKFLEESENDRQFMLRHEAWHVIGFDMLRVKDKDPQKWNEACDYWINAMIYHDSSYKLSLPSGGLYSEQFINWDKEKIYEHIVNRSEDTICNKYGSDIRYSDSDDVSSSMSESLNIADVEKDLAQMISKSAIQAKSAGGHIPADIQEYLDNLLNPKLKWNQILLKYMNSFAKYDYSFKRPNKRMLHQGIYLPSCYSEKLGTIYIATDESVSVTPEEYKLYIGAIEDIQNNLEPSEINVIGFTTIVTHVTKVEKANDLDLLKKRTLGGTDVRCVFNYIKEKNIRPEVLIVFSDMETRLPDKPNYDVIWVCINNPNWKPPKYGKVIYVNR